MLVSCRNRTVCVPVTSTHHHVEAPNCVTTCQKNQSNADEVLVAIVTNTAANTYIHPSFEARFSACHPLQYSICLCDAGRKKGN